MEDEKVHTGKSKIQELVKQGKKYFSEAEQINSSVRTRSIRWLKRAYEDYSKAWECYIELAFDKSTSVNERESYHNQLDDIEKKRKMMDEKIRKYRALEHEEKMRYLNGEIDI